MASSQFSANAPNSPRTTGPHTRTWVSRQWSGSCASPVHSSAIPTPPVRPTEPSATRILRCVRLASRFAAYALTGRKRETRTPASTILSIRSRSSLTPPIASMITLHSTPARARSHSASATSCAMSPVQ